MPHGVNPAYNSNLIITKYPEFCSQTQKIQYVWLRMMQRKIEKMAPPDATKLHPIQHCCFSSMESHSLMKEAEK